MKRIVFLLSVATAFGQTHAPRGEYALILQDPPVAEKSQSRDALSSPAALAHLAKVRGAQSAVLAELARRKVLVRRAAQVLVNAIYVTASGESVRDLAAIPGVKRVQYLPPVRRDLNAAVSLVGASAAWSAVGGAGNAGAGIKIGIIDTGIDLTHPGMQDTSLRAPSGFPKGDAAYTNGKVIVARSYVSLLTLADPQYSSPDDLSPRDRTGHGTAIAMIAAGAQNTGPLGTIQGVAPKAYIGNYKIFGSPGVNDYTYADVVEQALTDALSDGMDVVTLSLNEGDMAVFGPLDGQAACEDTICDVRAQAVENAIAKGLVVVTSAGNDGNVGAKSPSRNSIHTPGTAPNAITVGATMNSHSIYQTVRFGNSSVRGLFGDGTRTASAITAPARDVASLGNDGLGCAALPAGSLTGRIALMQRGTCFFADKINFAQAAGAKAVVIYQVDGSEDIYPVLYVQNTNIPAVLIGNTDGKALKSYLAANADGTVTLDPALLAADNGRVNTVAAFSSRGPSIGNFANQRDFAVKPELVAPGTDIYTATQTLDPNGDTYNLTGYTGVSGTSYAVPFVAGAVALVKQKNPSINTPGRLKSAVVNTATADVQGGAHIADAGAGKLNIADAVNVAATLEPAAIGFGALATASLPIKRSLVLTNVSGASATFTFSARALSGETAPGVQITPSSATVAAGQQATVAVALTGTPFVIPAPGAYEGFIDVTGAGPTLHLPYTYFVGDNIPFNIFPLQSGSFIDFPGGAGWRLSLRVTDQFGVPVTGVQSRITTPTGAVNHGGSVTTDAIGTAAWIVDLGPQLGDQIFTATVSGLTQRFEGFARLQPKITSGGVVNAAPPFQLGQGLAPGSYISIFGSTLADTTAVFGTPYLPVSLASIAVSFDDGSLSVPGHIHFVSPSQVNVQVPWELQGHTSVRVKVTWSDYYYTGLVLVPISRFSPGIFAITDAAGGVIGTANPAKRGQPLIIYANGLGAVDRQPPSGEPTPGTLPLANTTTSPSVTIGSSAGQIQFSGLAPNYVGLYQVNVGVAADAPTGSQPLKLSIGGQDVTVNIVVQ